MTYAWRTRALFEEPASSTSGVGVLILYTGSTSGASDVTARLQALIDSVGDAPYDFILPYGTHLTSDTLLIRYNRQRLIGLDEYGSVIKFNPTAHDKAAITVAQDAGATVISHCAVKQLRIYSTDTTYRKIGIDVYDASFFTIQDVTIGPQSAFLGGGASIGIRLSGREFVRIHDSMVWANDGVALHIRNNSHAGVAIDQDYLDIDRCVFSGDMTAGSTQPIITLDAGVQITRSTIRNVNLSFGGNGFKYVDGTSSTTSNHLSFDNVHWEQGTSANGVGYFITVDRTGAASLLNLSITNCSSGGDLLTNGIYVRNVLSLDIRHFLYPNNTGEVSLNLSAVTHAFLANNFEQNGSVRVMTAMREVFFVGRDTITAIPSGTIEVWASTTNTNLTASARVFGVNDYRESGTIAPAALVSIPMLGGTVNNGTVIVSATGPTLSASGIASVDKFRATLLGGGAASNFDAANTAGRLCVLWASAAAVNLLNNTAETLSYQFTWIYRL